MHELVKKKLCLVVTLCPCEIVLMIVLVFENVDFREEGNIGLKEHQGFQRKNLNSWLKCKLRLTHTPNLLALDLGISSFCIFADVMILCLLG
jgi:hypothetical protein